MHPPSRLPLVRLFFVFISLFVFMAPVKADFDYAYCSSQNTDSGSPTWSEWQSNGFCTNKCKGSVFAVILQNDCWCSNYAPGADQQSPDDCKDPCPGYPTERCGNKNKKLYVYVRVAGAQASGTKGAPKSTSSTSASSTNAPSPSSTEKSSRTTTSRLRSSVSDSVVQTKTDNLDKSTSIPTPNKPSTQDPATSPTLIPSTAPQTTIRTISMSNSIVTETVVTTPTSTPVEVPAEKSAPNTGAIVGGVVGGVVGLAALAGGIFFVLWRRRRQLRAEQDDDRYTGMQRNVSTMSKSGLLRTENPSTQPPPIATTFARRQSRNLDQESISPISGSDRRNSRPMIDQRLNPSAIFVLDNSSRGSLGSMDDSRDYHRPLNIRNPDP